jgi:2-methylisocitrate lyase-like PEP mutase family enzyme
LQLIGVHDAFSARIAAKEFEGIFLSGFGFAASQFGLPDIGYISWTDIAAYTARIRSIVGYGCLMLVDVDDGYGDKEVAANNVRHIENCGASAVMFEDQRRPRRCGHLDGKEVLPVDEYVQKLQHVLAARESLFVIARTDAINLEEGLERAAVYCDAGADGVMVEAINDLRVLERLASRVDKPIMVNQLHGGKSANWTIKELESAGASIVIYSTPCLFSAQHAIQRYLAALKSQSRLPAEGTVSLSECMGVLSENK